MSDAVEIRERPETKELYMIAGWRQWADAGSISSGLPQYLIEENEVRHIGSMKPDGFYLFQIPGTHHLVRPVVKFDEGYPNSLEVMHNEFFYTGTAERGTIIFLGDEPHLDIERYVKALLDTAEDLGVKRIVGLGGVYGELPYEKERSVSCIYSLKQLKDEVAGLSVTLSDYEGGASIGSYLCKRAGERGMEFVSFYAFVPTYDFSSFSAIGNSIRIENDFMAWLGVMRRINHMLDTDFDLKDLSLRAERLVEVMDSKVTELERELEDSQVREYFKQLSEDFEEVIFNPLADVWEDELRRLFGDEDEN